MTDAPERMPETTPDAGFFSRPRASMAAMGVAVVALGLAAVPYARGNDFDARVRAYLLANPQVLDEVVQARDARTNETRSARMNAAVAADPGILSAGAREPAFGPADARVTVVEFFDYQCPYCKTAAPAYMALMQAHPDVRFIFKEWAILDQGESITSQYAARAALAAHAQGKYLPVHRALMAERPLSPQIIDRILTTNGVDLARARTAIASPETSRLMADIQAGAATVGIEGTPTFFINGRVTTSNDPAQLDGAIRAAKAG